MVTVPRPGSHRLAAPLDMPIYECHVHYVNSEGHVWQEESDQIGSHYISSSHTRLIRCLTLKRVHLM